MSLEETLKDLINDVEKLKAVGGEANIINEIKNFSETLTITDVLSINTNQKQFAETLTITDSLTVNANQKQFAETLTLSDTLEVSEQDTGTFVYGTARYGFSDYA